MKINKLISIVLATIIFLLGCYFVQNDNLVIGIILMIWGNNMTIKPIGE